MAGNTNGCYNGVTLANGLIVTGSIMGCTTGINYSNFLLLGGSLSLNTTQVAHSGDIAGNFLSAQASNYNGVNNDSRAWSGGGYMDHEATIVPSGFTYSHRLTGVDSNYYTYVDYPLGGQLNAKFKITCHAKNDAAGLAAGERVSFQIISPASDPMLGGAALAEWVSDDSTDWQSHVLEYTRAIDIDLILRVTSKRASGNGYYQIKPMGGTSGGQTILFMF
jgi:hypothetical protein